MKILLTADFLSEKPQTVNYHSTGILRILKETLSLSDNRITVDIFKYGNSSTDIFFDLNAFFNLSGMSYRGGLPDLFDPAKLTRYSIDYFGKLINKYDLIIGYELTTPFVCLLENFSKKYINIWLHPIRYLDDELFYVQSNVESIRNILQFYNISESTYYINAEYAKVLISRRNALKDIKKGSVVFFGQTANDKTLRKLGGGYLSLSDYKLELKEILRNFENIYYSKHPLRRDDDEFNLLKELVPRVININCNGYQLLSNENINLVLTISSSIGIESYFFKKNTIFLKGLTVDIKSGGISLGTDLFDPVVWKKIFNTNDNNMKSEIFFFGKKNKIRNILDAYYSYPILRDHYGN